MSNENIPPLLVQYRDNMLDKTNSVTVRYNYKVTIENIKDYCDKALRDFDKIDGRKH